MSDKVQGTSIISNHAELLTTSVSSSVNSSAVAAEQTRTVSAAAAAASAAAAAAFAQESAAISRSSSQEEEVYCNPLLAERLTAQPPPVASYLDYQQQSYKPDRDLEEKVRKACERISENVHICANEPSLALYRLTEHVRKALPPTVESRTQIQHLHQQLQGVYYDAEYGLESVKSMGRASPHLRNVQDLLKNSLFLKQQIKHEQQRSLKLHEKHKAALKPPS